MSSDDEDDLISSDDEEGEHSVLKLFLDRCGQDSPGICTSHLTVVWAARDGKHGVEATLALAMLVFPCFDVGGVCPPDTWAVAPSFELPRRHYKNKKQNLLQKIPKEGQTMSNLMLVRDMVENTLVKMRCVPATHMLADILTKEMPKNETFWKFNEIRRYS